MWTETKHRLASGITLTISSENGFINIFFCAHLFIDSISTTFTEIMH